MIGQESRKVGRQERQEKVGRRRPDQPIGIAIAIEKTGNQRLKCELKCRSLSVETKCEIKCEIKCSFRCRYRYRKKLETRDLGWMITMKSMKRHEKEQKTQDQKTQLSCRIVSCVSWFKNSQLSYCTVFVQIGEIRDQNNLSYRQGAGCWEKLAIKLRE